MAIHGMSSLPDGRICAICARPKVGRRYAAASVQEAGRFVKNCLTSLRENNNDMRVYGSLSD